MAAILDNTAAIVKQQAKPLEALSNELRLMEYGLDTFGNAVLVANRDYQFSLDPLAAHVATDFPLTVGNFIPLHENAAA